MELLLTLAAVAAVAGLSGLGILVLPWTELEVSQTIRAAETLPQTASALANVHVQPEVALAR